MPLKIVGIVASIIASLLGLIVAAVAFVLLVFDWDMLRDEAEAFASTLAGRDVTIGALDVDLGWTTRVRLADVAIANASWAEGEHLLAAENAEIAVRVWPTLWGRAELPEIVLETPILDLMKDAEGRVNWDLAAGADAAKEAATPDEREEFPTIGRLIVRGGEVRYTEPARQLDLDGAITIGEGEAEEGDQLTLTLQGKLEGKPAELRFIGGSVLSLRDSDDPYPVDLELAAGDTRVAAKGTLTEPLAMRGMDLALTVEGPSMAEIFPIFRIPLPDTPPYRVTGQLSREGQVWRFQGFEGVVGDSDLTGSLAIDYGPEKPFLTADLVSRKLDFDDLAGLVGATPDPAETASAEQKARAAANPGVFPDIPIASDRLHVMNMDVTFKGEQVISPTVPVERLEFRVQVDNGRALARPLSFAVAGGTVSGEMALNGREKVPSADADLTFENLDLKPFFRGSDFFEQMGGRFFGHLYLLGVGNSVAEMMAVARGEGAVAMREGSISGLLVEAAGLDLIEALVLIIGEDARVPIRCGRADVKVDNGIVQIKQGVVDTTDSTLVTRGRVDLGKEAFDLQIEARAKDFSLIDAAAPVRVYGPFTDPSFAIGGLDPLPFFEMGDQENIDCEALLQGALTIKTKE